MLPNDPFNPLPSFSLNTYESSYYYRKSPLPKELDDAYFDWKILHDPFSEISLFLFRKIKGFIHTHSSYRLTASLQEELLASLLPDFKTAFPKCKLHTASLSHYFQKVVFYLEEFQGKKEAFHPDGSLHIDFLIALHLSQTCNVNSTYPTHPYFLAHQIARQIAESVAVMEGRKIDLIALTRRIWFVMRHIVENRQHYTTPYDDLSDLDRYLIKWIVSFKSFHPLLSHLQIQQNLKQLFTSFKMLMPLKNKEALLSSEIAKQSAPFFPHVEQNAISIEAPHYLSEEIKGKILESFLDNPGVSFNTLQSELLSFLEEGFCLLKKYTEEEIDEKCALWTSQGDFVLSFSTWDKELFLVKEIINFSSSHEKALYPFIEELQEFVLQKVPHLAALKESLFSRIRLIVYSLQLQENTPNSLLDRLLSLYVSDTLSKHENLTEELLQQKLLRRFAKLCPLIPESFVLELYEKKCAAVK